jgi:RelE toxin of RelE / RelB toxin-antitoxin system
MHCVMETEAFARQASIVGLTEDERHEIASLLSEEPMRGELIPGTGGARKFRFAKSGMGKRSGYRIISYYAADDVPVFLLDVLDKGARLNLSPGEKNQLKKVLGRVANEYRKATKDKIRSLAGIAS